MKFQSLNLDGTPSSFFLVEEFTPTVPTVAKTVTHHIFVMDASGSMYYDMAEMRSRLEAILTVAEFRDTGMLVSLISYASSGDVVTHFERVSVADITASSHIQHVRNLHTRGMTCISQALEAAFRLVNPNETTAISLHSDGYANDRSPSSEKYAIDKVLANIPANTFINAVAYRDSVDFTLLSRIANAGSGQCVKVRSSAELYKALHNTSVLLSNTLPTIHIPINGAGYVVCVSDGKVVGSDTDMTVRGYSNPPIAYRYRKVDSSTYASSTEAAYHWGSNSSTLPLMALSRYLLATGAINDAKRVAIASCVTDLKDHLRALTQTQVAAFAVALESEILSPSRSFTSNLTQSGPTVLDVILALNADTSAYRLDASFLSSYRRRGAKRIPGSRNKETGEIIPCPVTVQRKAEDFIPVTSFNLNESTASINMKTIVGATILRDGKEVKEVAGIPLDLKDYRDFSLVTDGELNADVLPLRIHKKTMFDSLANLGVVDGVFDPSVTVNIQLSNLPLAPLANGISLDGIGSRILYLKTTASALRAFLKDEAEATPWTPEQVEALKDHCLSPSLYINLPTTTPYSDRSAAINEGQLDFRISYRIGFGTTDILSSEALHSANKFLDRTYVVEGVDKPSMRDIRKGALSHKVQSSRVKLTHVDAFQKDVFDGLLGFVPGFNLLTCTVAEAEARLAEVEAEIASIFTNLSPLVYQIGSTGFVPEDFPKAMNAEQILIDHPTLVGIGKKETEGTFYVVGNTVVSVYAESVEFTP